MRSNFLGAILGTAFVMIFMAIMNTPVKKDNSNKVKVTDFGNIENKTKKSEKVEEILREKPKPKSAPKNLAPDISSLLKGNNFGIDAYKVDLSDLSQSLLGDMSNIAMTEDSVDIAPIPTVRPPLDYPETARNKGISGYVNLTLMINKEGIVEQVKIVESNPEGIFDHAAVSAVKGWKFRPAVYKGDSVAIWVKQKISFNLN